MFVCGCFQYSNIYSWLVVSSCARARYHGAGAKWYWEKFVTIIRNNGWRTCKSTFNNSPYCISFTLSWKFDLIQWNDFERYMRKVSIAEAGHRNALRRWDGCVAMVLLLISFSTVWQLYLLLKSPNHPMAKKWVEDTKNNRQDCSVM